MRADRTSGAKAGRLRVALLGLIIVSGLAGIVGSGGGAPGFPDLSCLNSGTCPVDPLPPPRVADLGPTRVTAQVGGTVVFQVITDVDQPTYRWCRRPFDGAECSVIDDATGPALTLAGLNLADDATLIGVTVTGTNGTAFAFSRLAVSSMPGVIFEDGDFTLPDWSITSSTEPAVGGPVVAATRAEAGGHPGAYRAATYTFTASPSSARVFYGALSSVYDPSVSGAIYTMDFAEDCLRAGTSNLLGTTAPMIEQSGRRFMARGAVAACRIAGWNAVRRASLVAADFTLVAGPACTADQPCPDFSASGAPIQLGLVGGSALDGGLVPPVTVVHGFDNWKVTVWRH